MLTLRVYLPLFAEQYGKLSDIYGRKPLLLTAYACYCFGGLLAYVVDTPC
jgi:MFS family permease